MSELCPHCRQRMPKSADEMREEHMRSIMNLMKCSRECAEFLDSFGDWSRQGSGNLQERERTMLRMNERKISWDKIHELQRKAEVAP